MTSTHADPDAIKPPLRDLVVFNASFRVCLTGPAPDVAPGIEQARGAIDGGRARRVLEHWRAMV